VEWPNGVAGIQMCANTGDYIGLARILEAFANLAENTLKTTMGRVRYLLGLPLTRDAMRFTTHGVTGFSATRGFFSLPQSAIPFLFDVLEVPWCNANNERTEKAIIRGAARNRNIIRTLTEKGWGQHYASPRLPVREIVDMLKTGHDEDIQNPVMSGHESSDLCVRPWEYKRGNGKGIVQSRTSTFDPDNILNPTIDINVRVVLEVNVDPNAYDEHCPTLQCPDADDLETTHVVNTTETSGSSSAPRRSTTLLLGEFNKGPSVPVMTGRDNNVETDPALQGVSEIDAATLRKKENKESDSGEFNSYGQGP
jgi:hypothetical protein